MPTSALEAFGELTGRLAWLGLVHSLWVGLLIASGVALVLQAAPRLTHRARHAILVVAMLAVALGPIAFATAQLLARTRAGKGPAPFAGTWLVVRAGTSGSAAASPPQPPSLPNEAPRRPGPLELAAVAIARAVDAIRTARPLVLSAWSTVAASLCAVLALGGIGLRRLCRGAESAPAALQARSRRLARLLRLRRRPRVLVHAGPAEPLLCGLLRSAIVLPREWAAGASPECLDAVLAHELAHARRHDPLVNLVQRLVEVAFFFHPAVHRLSRSLRREREICADALAVRLTGDPLALAEALRSVALLRLKSPRVPAVASSLGGPSVSLLPRIQELIGMTPSRPRFSLWPFAALPAAGFLALIAAAAGISGDQPPEAPARLADGPGSLTPRSRSRPAHDNDRQISYEVRYIVCPAEPWRQLCLARMKPVKQEADYSAWLLDEKGLFDLLTQAQADTRSNVLMAPKVTSFEGAKATITSRTETWYVAGVDFDSEKEAFRPVTKSVKPGMRVEMTGTTLTQATRLSVKAEDTLLLGVHSMRMKKQRGGKEIAAQYQIPSTLNRKWGVDCDVSDGSLLVISLGVHDRPGSLPERLGLANDVLGAVGLPQYHAATYPEETLVLIRPRRIILESEEQPIRPASRVKAGSKSS